MRLWLDAGSPAVGSLELKSKRPVVPDAGQDRFGFYPVGVHVRRYGKGTEIGYNSVIIGFREADANWIRLNGIFGPLAGEWAISVSWYDIGDGKLPAFRVPSPAAKPKIRRWRGKP